MLVIGTPVKLRYTFAFDDAPDAVEGTVGHVSDIHMGDMLPYTVALPDPNGGVTHLTFDLAEVEVLRDDQCHCYLLTGEQAQMADCGQHPSWVNDPYAAEARAMGAEGA